MSADPTLGTPDTIIFPFLGAELGGSHISAFTLGKELQDNFAKRCIVIAAADSRIAKEAADYGFEVVASRERPAMRNNPLFDLLRFPARMGTLKKFGRHAIVHCNDIGALQAWGPAARLLRIPVVYHHRALNRMVFANRIVLNIADAVICIADNVRRSLSGLSKGRISTILNPFSISLAYDRNSSRAALIRRYGFEPDSLLVGFIGNFWHRKRPHFFLDTAKTILNTNPKARFILFGRSGEITDGELGEYARKLGLAERTTFAGFQLPVEENVAALDVLLAPAIAEPFGRTLVEALLLGTPYVATGDAGHTEIASRWQGGVLVEAGADAEQFARAALAVIAQSSSIVLPEAKRAAVAEELSARGHTRNVLKVYEKVAAGR